MPHVERQARSGPGTISISIVRENRDVSDNLSAVIAPTWPAPTTATFGQVSDHIGAAALCRVVNPERCRDQTHADTAPDNAPGWLGTLLH